MNKTIVQKVKAPDQWFGVDYNMNIYRGCSHGCIYCDSRSHCFKIENFSTIVPKENALEVIRNDLRRKVTTGVVGNGAMGDPYNPLEKTLKLTRNSLELMNAFGFGASITTKSPLVTRDIDVLQDIQSHSPVVVNFSITTADDVLCKTLEPRVAPTSDRLNAMAALADSGIFTGVFVIPMLPFLTDTPENIQGILRQAKAAGARFVYTYMGMTLRPGSREYFYSKLDDTVREQYQKRYGFRKNLTTPHGKKLWEVFVKECEQLGLLYDMKGIAYYYKGNASSSQ